MDQTYKDWEIFKAGGTDGTGQNDASSVSEAMRTLSLCKK